MGALNNVEDCGQNFTKDQLKILFVYGQLYYMIFIEINRVNIYDFPGNKHFYFCACYEHFGRLYSSFNDIENYNICLSFTSVHWTEIFRY